MLTDGAYGMIVQSSLLHPGDTAQVHTFSLPSAAPLFPLPATSLLYPLPPSPPPLPSPLLHSGVIWQPGERHHQGNCCGQVGVSGEARQVGAQEKKPHLLG